MISRYNPLMNALKHRPVQATFSGSATLLRTIRSFSPEKNSPLQRLEQQLQESKQNFSELNPGDYTQLDRIKSNVEEISDTFYQIKESLPADTAKKFENQLMHIRDRVTHQYPS